MMKRILVSIFMCGLVNTTFAASSGNVDIKEIRTHNSNTYVSTSVQPDSTCNSWGEFLKFDHKTETGKAFLSMLLSAKMSGKQVNIWYTPATYISTTHSLDCNDSTMATISGVAIL